MAEHRLTVEGRVIQFTISLGIACYPEDGEAHGIIIKKADDAMYRSKRAGRNRVTVWSQDDQAQGSPA